MKKWMAVIPAAVAAGAAALMMTKKDSDSPAKKDSSGKAASGGKKEKAAAPKALKLAEYSFASGYKDAKTVLVSFQYDSNIADYSVISEEYLCETDDSHAGVLHGYEIDMQVEYAAYYHGEDFAAMTKDVQERFKNVQDMTAGGNTGIRYFNGNKMCLAFPVEGSTADYVLISVLRKGDKADEYEALPELDELQDILKTLQIKAE